jgi:hypothetical protein
MVQLNSLVTIYLQTSCYVRNHIISELNYCWGFGYLKQNTFFAKITISTLSENSGSSQLEVPV